nr:hypothetical protein [uncultured Draconibacterium sp.]
MIIDVKKEFGHEIENLWLERKFESIDIKERGFGVQREINCNALFFIGINPSYNDKPGSVYYENLHGETHRYFKKFIEISSEVEMKWTHLDLLYVRETSQNKVKSITKTNLGHEFIDEQLRITKRIIEMAKPQIVVVNNTYARDLLMSDSFSSLKFEFEFDENLGTERIVNHSLLAGTPVFFSSMLTGQRALDRGSYRRLIWHINYVKRMINK